MCRVSTTLSFPSSKSSSRPTSVRSQPLSLFRHRPNLTLGHSFASDRDPESFDVSLLPEHALSAIEADCFWCLEKMLSGIPDYYIHGQPGIMRSVKKMTELVARIDRE